MDRLPAPGQRSALLNRWLDRVGKGIVSRNLFRDGQRILVAVSGGLDSMMLLHVLHALAPAHHWTLTVAHFNHQLRGRAAAADERLARRSAHALKLRCVTGRADVRAAAHAAGISLEMAGRQLRHDFLARTARRLRIPSIALAHHADDQVELFFLRLLRGTGASGLAGMQWSNPSPSNPSVVLARPLLDQSKAALRRAAQAAGVRYSDDATNASLDIHRNRVRHELLPLLRRRYQPRLEERVLRLMELAGAEGEVAAAQAQRWLGAARRPQFDRLPAAVQRRVILAQLRRLGLSPDSGLVERLRLTPVAPVALNERQSVWRDADGTVRLGKIAAFEFDPARKEIVLTNQPGRAVFGGLTLEWRIEKTRGAKFAPKPNAEYFDADKVGGRVCLRHWQPGDRFQPIGEAAGRKLQDLFTNLKVPRLQRHGRVVAATSRGELFWVEGLRMSEGFKLEAGTVRRLTWQWHR
jgi:tRNA(Ile)-lysidine synthase